MRLPQFSTLNSKTVPKDLHQKIEQYKKEISHALDGKKSAEDLLIMMNQQGDELERFWGPCAHLNAVVGSDEWRECYREGISLLSAFDTYVHQNKALYDLLACSAQLSSPGLIKMREDFLLNCRLSGIHLDEQQRKQVEQIQERLDTLSQDFQNHVTDSQKEFRFHTEDEDQLRGLPKHLIMGAQKRAEEEDLSGFVLGLEQPTYTTIVSYAHNAELRKLYFKAYGRRASQADLDNTPVIQEILQKREELSKLLGLQNYAEYSLSSKMAKHAKRVEEFLKGLLVAAWPVAQHDMQVLNEFARHKGHKAALEPWDTAYYLQMRQQEIFSIDQEALRDYFPLSKVMHGLDLLLQKLYGLHLEKQERIDVWHPDVEVYALYQDTQVLGVVYCDWFARSGKRSGAWMDSLQTYCVHADKNPQMPITTLTCNFATAMPGLEAGLTHEELLTLLHEFGHCLHHLLSEVPEFSVSGVHGVEWDAVELPSQWMENWGWQEQYIELFSQHIQTGRALPHEQFAQLLAMKNDMIGLYLLRQVLFGLYDMSIHLNDAPAHPDAVHAQYLDLLEQYAVWPYDKAQRFPQSFSHIFAGGYAAGYYSYLWADVLSSDVFEAFSQDMSQMSQLGQKFRQNILSKGGSCSALEAFVDFRGREPDEQALLRAYGLQA